SVSSEAAAATRVSYLTACARGRALACRGMSAAGNVLAWVVIVNSVGVMACSNGSDSRPQEEGSRCAAPRGCDIQEATCVQAVLEVTACVRGEEVPALPTIRHLNQREYRDELTTDALDVQMASGQLDRLLQRLHLLPAQTTAIEQRVNEQAEQTLALFDAKTKRITIVEGAIQSAPLDEMVLLSHELTHYLQDLRHPLTELSKQYESTLDQTLSLRALLEGEALVSSLHVLERIAGSPVGWSSVLASTDDSVFTNIADSPAQLHAAALSLPYALGAHYVADVWHYNSRAHVDDLFEEAPHSLIDWLAGYGDGKLQASRVEPLDCALPHAPDGYELVLRNDFGAAGLIALLAAAGDLDDTLTARHLRASALAVYAPQGEDSEDPDASMLVWRMRFASAEVARELADRLPWDDVGVRVFDREVVLAVGPNVTRDAPPSEVDTCPTFDEPSAR
ncbi:MAG: hypothetical protein ABW321_02870, partial [Polyangiales bacterium]